ncbi:protein phosphatase type 1 complex subunit Hex2/Reg1 [Xylariaceae sp. FL0016]|nr:protein phosphatase type 1 complex subunit Hex2/Reg1 [Xylariaceae sp. FL0016]
MAVVLTTEDSSLFSSSSLRRSHSQPKFVSKPSHGFPTSASASRLNDLFQENYHHQPIHFVPDSSPSSAPSSPHTLAADSSDPSYSSTPATNLSLDGQCDSDIHSHPDLPLIPDYGNNPYFGPLEDLEPPPSPRTGDSYTCSPADQDASVTTSRPDSPVCVEHAEDDSAVNHHPTHHVDYLSHNWKEEDIWSSWRYIVSKRAEFSNGPRLENASWRTWMKAKYRLKTVSPETLNWLKDCDVTWLYGPLQTRQRKMFPTETDQSSSTLSRSDSFIHKKPILKKRSMSEVMLQRSLSSSSLLKQATAVVQAQQQVGTDRGSRPILQRATTADYVTYPFSARRKTHENTSLIPSACTSGAVSPSAERKHIHFDEQVQQCIAVDIKGDDDDDEANATRWKYDDIDSDSDDGAIMMKQTKTRKRPIMLRKKTPTNPNAESKTIAMLPSTKLKCRDESPAPSDSAMKHSSTHLRGSVLSPSPSQETLRPSKSSGAFFGEEDEFDHNGCNEHNPSNTSPTDSTAQRWHSSISDSHLANNGEPAGMRRTESGMFMPYEEGDVQSNDGIIGRVIDTVNTARDIAHVIWNVGWRR